MFQTILAAFFYSGIQSARTESYPNLQMCSFYRPKSLVGRENLQLYRYSKLLLTNISSGLQKNAFLQQFFRDG
ncbi:hypothetical protein VN24_04690 [Paenibacillus beijingensis]|uniref:Uncharacterized protein n=1 Tax=Paenibacillus beijingensis TaxID=1126833 RepID=A0A0D5NF62_9BACL|nr:hypothetical protein VN24_04690 [Paenibacillus beijingensis]